MQNPETNRLKIQKNQQIRTKLNQFNQQNNKNTKNRVYSRKISSFYVNQNQSYDILNQKINKLMKQSTYDKKMLNQLDNPTIKKVNKQRIFIKPQILKSMSKLKKTNNKNKIESIKHMNSSSNNPQNYSATKNYQKNHKNKRTNRYENSQFYSNRSKTMNLDLISSSQRTNQLTQGQPQKRRQYYQEIQKKIDRMTKLGEEYKRKQLGYLSNQNRLNDSRMKIMIKTNSNNRVLHLSERNGHQEEGKDCRRQNNVSGFLSGDYLLNRNNDDGNIGGYLFNCERIHHKTACKLSEDRLLSYHRLKKNVVMTNLVSESKKSKINQAHNSYVLRNLKDNNSEKMEIGVKKEDKNDKIHKVDCNKGRKQIEVPLELGINKLKIQQKGQRNNINNNNNTEKLVISPKKSTPKLPIQKSKQKPIRFQDVQPWQFAPQNKSHFFLNNNSQDNDSRVY